MTHCRTHDAWVIDIKVERVLRVVISSQFRMGQYGDDYHREDAPHFINHKTQLAKNGKILNQMLLVLRVPDGGKNLNSHL